MAACIRSAARWTPLLLLCALSACGGGGRRVASGGGGVADYAAPGPAGDPWGPYIDQASRRFDVPQAWIRAVMRQETGGRQYAHGQPITSDAGAMGLMQIMPATYGELAARFGLGSDPYEPHDNIMAGTGYIKDLYERFGSPAFLAAYDAGPHRLETYLAGGGNLPNETVNYLASAAPNLGQERPMTGPLAAFADGGLARPPPVLHAFARAPASRCWQDPDAAYDPDAPCRAAPVQVAEAPQEAVAPSAFARLPVRPAFAPLKARQIAATGGDCRRDPDAAYDPSAPCDAAPRIQVAQMQVPQVAAGALPPPVPMQQYAGLPPVAPHPYANPPAARCQHDPDAAYDPAAPCQSRVAVAPAALSSAAPYRFPGNLLISSAAASTMRTVPSGGRWAIQVGAFGSAELARRTADSVRSLVPDQLGSARVTLGSASPFGGHVLYRARLVGLSADSAAAACRSLQSRAQSCVSVPPGG